MGIFGVIGKMAGSKIVEKVEDELTKKQNREQTSGYCKYIRTNVKKPNSSLQYCSEEFCWPCQSKPPAMQGENKSL